MNAYWEVQSSGIQLPDRTPAPLYQPFHARPQWPERRQHPAIREDLKRQMADSAAKPVAALDEVRRCFVMPSDSSVSTFLSAHRAIPQILLEAEAHLKACFGRGVVLSLRAPVDASGSQTLYVVAMWSGNVRDARQALASFDDTWWMAHARQASGYLAFTYELV